MIKSSFAIATLCLLAGSASAQAPDYGQCGGIGWTGATTCPSGWSCQVGNAYYSQCLPGSGSGAPTTAPVTQPTQPVGQPGTTTTVGSGTGNAGGYWYSLYEEVNSGVTMKIGTGTYTLSWSAAAVDVVAGIGWATGSARAITYSGSFTPNGNAYLAVYGWTTSPLVEYYILESYGTYNPSSGLALKGTVTSDGGTYNIYSTVRTNAPSIQGTQTFNQFWSVRTSKRVGGTVTTANHFNAWKSLGMAMGAFNYQILATEGYESSGSSAITIS